MIGWLSVGLTLCGSILIARKSSLGFLFWLTANATWIAWAAPRQLWEIVALNVAYASINVAGIRIWRKKHGA